MLDENFDWKRLFSEGHMGALLDLVDYISAGSQHLARTAAGQAILNSEDAAAVAVMCRRNKKAASILNARPKQLRRTIMRVCLEEVRRATEEAHVGAVIEDIQCIEDELGLDLGLAKTRGYERLQKLFFADDLEDEPDATEYFESLDRKEELSELMRNYSKEIDYLDELLAGLVADEHS